MPVWLFHFLKNYYFQIWDCEIVKPSIFNPAEGVADHTALTMELHNFCISTFFFIIRNWLKIHLHHSVFQLKKNYFIEINNFFSYKFIYIFEVILFACLFFVFVFLKNFKSSITNERMAFLKHLSFPILMAFWKGNLKARTNK